MIYDILFSNATVSVCITAHGMRRLELPTLDHSGDTRLLSSVLTAQAGLTTLEDSPLTADLLLGLLVRLTLLDTGIASRFGTARCQSSVLLDSAGQTSWTRRALLLE